MALVELLLVCRSLTSSLKIQQGVPLLAIDCHYFGGGRNGFYLNYIEANVQHSSSHRATGTGQ